MLTEAEVLNETYKLLEKGWCQGASARTADGHYTTIGDPDAVCFCLTGAMRRVCDPDKIDNRSLFYAVAETLLSVIYKTAGEARIGETPPPSDHPSNVLAVWNDIPQRTQSRVLEVVAEARDLAKVKVG